MINSSFNINIKFTKRQIILPIAAFLLCLTPLVFGAETYVMTSYYPAPYGGYVQLLATNNAFLARDGGRVGIGTATPSSKLEIANGDAYVNTGNMGISGGVVAVKANNGVAWENAATLSYEQGGTLELGGTGGTPHIDFKREPSDYQSRIIMTSPGNLELETNLTVTGTSRAQIIQTGRASEGSGCAAVGQIAVTNNGDLLSCRNGKWQMPRSKSYGSYVLVLPVNTCVISNNITHNCSCPEGSSANWSGVFTAGSFMATFFICN